jgi:hypothetical protein
MVVPRIGSVDRPLDAHHDTDVVGEREAMLAWVKASFARGDQPAALRAMTPDIEVVVPGSTPFAGTYRGGDEVHRWLLAMSRAFVPAGRPNEFSHEGDDMVLHQWAWVRGREWLNCFRFTFDGPRMSRIVWEPEDIATFDELITEVLEDAGDRP